MQEFIILPQIITTMAKYLTYNKVKALVFALFCMPYLSFAQSVTPVFDLLDETNPKYAQTEYEGSAPIRVKFKAQPEGFENPENVYYEWQFFEEGNTTTPYDIKRDEEFEYTFTKSGQHSIICKATYEGLDYTNNDVTLLITAYESKLEFPNAFSPGNGDGLNDTFKAKKGHQSIVEFKAAIFNRWGQCVFQFKNIDDEWDGTYNGKPVKDGVYFLHCEAKGADGKVYHIRRDVNILRSFIERENNM